MGLFDFTMKTSIKNRNIIALFAFFIFDHVIWYYCGFFEHISLFYVIASELIRIIAGLKRIVQIQLHLSL